MMRYIILASLGCHSWNGTSESLDQTFKLYFIRLSDELWEKTTPIELLFGIGATTGLTYTMLVSATVEVVNT